VCISDPGWRVRIFLSSTFGDADREIVGQIETLLSSHNVQVVTGRRLGGGALTQQIMERIEGCDGCVALMTKRDQIVDPAEERWNTHPWVTDELNHARGQGVRAYALVENDVEVGGAYQEREWVAFDRAAPLAAFLALTDTIRLWKEDMGMTRVARVSPDDLGRQFRHNQEMKCRYRFVTPNGDRTEWFEAEPIQDTGGTLLHLKSVRNDSDQVEVEVLRNGQPTLISDATPQYLSIALERIGGG